MATSLGKVKPFVKVNRSAEIYGTTEYPLGGTNPPAPRSGPDAPNSNNQGPLLGTNYINLLNLRDYYKVPYPPVTPLASPPVIGILSFGGGVYGQPVSSGKYSGFWRCTDISGANGAPIQILVAPINGAINAPNADDGGATLENTVDVATVNAFYGMINQGRDAPVYTPPVIILYIAPSDDIEEVYKSFYTVLNNPVICNGNSYLPSVVCCSWGAPEVAWTQKMAFPPSGLPEDVDTSPNPAGIAVMNEINDLLANATRRGINICVASGDIQFPDGDTNEDGNINKGDLATAEVSFPASSPYVTCVGGSSVFFPNGAVRNFNNAGEFAWSRSDGGISNAFPIPDYQTNLPGSALISANAFLSSSRNTASLLEVSLGAANVDSSIVDLSGLTINASLSAQTKNEALDLAQLTYDNAVKAWTYAKAAGGSDSATLKLQLAMNAANTALAAAKENAHLAELALADAQDAVVKAVALEDLLAEAAVAYNVAAVAIANETGTAATDPHSQETQLGEKARDAALLVVNMAVAQGAESVIAPTLVSSLTENITKAAQDAQAILDQLAVPYDPFNPVAATALIPANLANIYKTVDESYPALENMNALVTHTQDMLDDVLMVDSSGNAYANAVDAQEAGVTGLSTKPVASVVAYATEAARLAKTVSDDTTLYGSISSKWFKVKAEFDSASDNWADVAARVPPSSDAQFASARARLTAANIALTSESVLLANADAANLLAANTLKAVTTAALSKVSAAAYATVSPGAAAIAALNEAKLDASGANHDALVAQESAGNSAIIRLADLVSVMDKNAAEAKRCFNDWKAKTESVDVNSSNSITAANARLAVVTAADLALAAATRVCSAANALSTLLDNSRITQAVPSWSGAASRTALTTAVNDASGALANISNAISNNVNARTLPSTTKIIACYGALATVESSGTSHAVFTAINTAVAAQLAIIPGSTSATTESILQLSTNVSNMLSSVLKAEGSMLYSASLSTSPIDTVVANYAAALSASNAIYDTFKAMNDSAKNAHDLAVLARTATNLANARSSLSTTAFGTATQTTLIVNQTMIKAAQAATAATQAAVEYNNLVFSFSSVTPALVDAAARSQAAIKIAADSSNLATASANIAPVTPQMVGKLQDLVLKAKASTQLALETDPTNTKLQSTLALWNAAVTAGAAALAGMAATQDLTPGTPENEELLKLFKAFSNDSPLGAVQLAYNNGTHNSDNNFPSTSDMYILGKAAYDFANSYFKVGINGGNLAYVMTAANTAIIAAWNAAQASNVAGSNAPRIAAEANWETAANKIAQIVSAGFLSGAYAPAHSAAVDSLKDAVYTAYHKVTALNASGVVVTADVAAASDANSTTQAYLTAVAAYKKFMLAYDSYNTDFLMKLQENSDTAALDKQTAQVAIALALAAAARANAAAKKSAVDSAALATSTQAIQDQAALTAAEAAYSAADNVNMYRCIPDIAMHADADDLPIIFRLNGGNVFVGGTSVAAAMFAGFLGVVQSHNSINYFMNPVLYNNFTYPSPLFYDISGTSELGLQEPTVTSRYGWVVSEKLDTMSNSLTPLIHGAYNPHVGLGSIRADALSAFLEAPNLVSKMVTGPFPVDPNFMYAPQPPTLPSIQYVDVRPGTTADVYVFVAPSGAYNTNVTWSCSSPYNATVSQTLQAYGPVDISTETGAPGPIYAMVYRARVTGVVPVDPLSPAPVITIASTDGSNVFTTVNVRVMSAIQVTGVSISAEGETKNPANTVLSLGKTLQLIATVSPANATNKRVYWWSSNTAIVNVDVDGLLTPLAPGQVTIKATTVNNNISASISVYVPTPMTGISVSPSMVTLNPNLLVFPLKNTQLIKATVTPENADYKYLSWEILSSQALALPPGTTNQYGVPLYYAGDNTIDTPVVAIHSPNGTVLKRDSSGNITDNTQDTVTAISNGSAIVRVSTNGDTEAVYGTYSANVIVNVVTPVTNVTLVQTNMVIDLAPQSARTAVNPEVNVQYGTQYGTKNQNLTLPMYNAAMPDRNLSEMYDVTATIFPEFPSNLNLIWTSSNPKVAIISNNTAPVLNTTASDPNLNLFQVTERITPLANGTTVIKVTTADGNKVAMVNVTVTTPVTSITLSAMPVTLNPGKQYALQATVLPVTASNSGLVWDTTNRAVATVDQNGLVTAVASGSCGISVSTVDGDYTAMATINVVTPLVGVSLVLNTPTPIHIGDMVQILVVMTPTTASDQQFTWTVTNGINGNIFTNGPAQNGNIVYLDAAQSGSAVFTVTTHDGNKQANLALTVVPY